MTLLYALVRILLMLVHPLVRAIGTWRTNRHDKLAAEVTLLAQEMSRRVSQDTKQTVAERIASNCRDQSKLAQLQAQCDGIEKCCLFWVGLDNRLFLTRNWLAEKPGPLCSMAMAYIDCIGSVAMFALGGGNDPFSISIDSLETFWEYGKMGVSLAESYPQVIGMSVGASGGLAGFVIHSIARRLFQKGNKA